MDYTQPNPDLMGYNELRLRLRWENERRETQLRLDHYEELCWKWMSRCSDLMDQIAELKGLK